MPEWPDTEYKAWLGEAARAYKSAMMLDASPEYLDLLGGVFALAAEDKRRLFRWHHTQARMEKKMHAAWREHDALIERRKAIRRSASAAVESYVLQLTGTWPQSLSQLRAANAYTTATLPYSKRTPVWYARLANLRRAVARRPDATATAAALANAAIQSLIARETTWREDIEFGMRVAEGSAPVREAAGALGIRKVGESTESAQAAKPVAAEVRAPPRPPLDPRARSDKGRPELRPPTSQQGTVGGRPTGRDRATDPSPATTAPRPPKGPRAGEPPAKPRAPSRPPTRPPAAPPPGGSSRPPRGSPLPPELRALMEPVLRGDRESIDAAARLFERFRKISRDPATVVKIAEVFRSTRGLPTLKGQNRTYAENRWSVGELRVITWLAKHEAIDLVKLLRPVHAKGARTPDTELVLTARHKSGTTLRLEIRTLTGAARGKRTPTPTPRGAEKKNPRKDESVDRPVTPTAVLEAVRSKLTRAQAKGGIIVINAPYGTTPPLSTTDLAKIRNLWKTHPNGRGFVKEIWILLPGQHGDASPLRFLAGEGLGLVTRFVPKP
jgi:hypothetical protein